MKPTDHRNSKDAVESRRAAWQGKLQAELVRMVDILRGCADIEWIIVFGSVGRGHARLHSDLDLIVIQRTDVRFVDRIARLCQRLRPRISTDLLVYTPEEWRDMCRRSGFARRVLDEGRVLYAAPAP